MLMPKPVSQWMTRLKIWAFHHHTQTLEQNRRGEDDGRPGSRPLLWPEISGMDSSRGRDAGVFREVRSV